MKQHWNDKDFHKGKGDKNRSINQSIMSEETNVRLIRFINIPLHSIIIKYESERNSLMSGFPESTAYVWSYLQYTSQQSMLSVSTRNFHSQLSPPDHLHFKFCQQNHWVTLIFIGNGRFAAVGKAQKWITYLPSIANNLYSSSSS